MKATTPWLGSALVAVLAVSAAAAQCPGGHAVRQAPDACGPGYYAPNEYGLWFGPNHDLYPPCMPFNGMVFGPGGPDGKDGKEAPGGPGGPYGPGAAGGPYGPAAAGGRMGLERRAARPALTDPTVLMALMVLTALTDPGRSILAFQASPAGRTL